MCHLLASQLPDTDIDKKRARSCDALPKGPIMLQNFLICVNAVLPAAIYLLIGIILKACHVITEDEVRRFTRVIFITLYPFMMFDNLYGKNFGDAMNLKIALYAVGFTVFQFAASYIFVCRIEKDDYERGAMIQALYRSNYVLLGFPIAINLFGKENITPIAVLMILIVPFYNITSVIIFEKFRGGKVSISELIRRILINPIIEGAIVALVFIVFRLELPETIRSTVTTLSDCTSPISLILLGASLNFQGFSSDRKRIAICTVGKLGVYPALAIAGAVLLGLRDVPLIAIVLMTATPDAIASYAMASSMGGNGRLAGELVVLTTLISCFTMPLWLFLLKSNGLF